MSRQTLFNCWATVGNMRVNFLPKLFNCWVTVGQKERAFLGKSGSTFPGSCLTVGQLLVSIGSEAAHVKANVVQLLGNCWQHEGQLSSEVVQLLGNCGSKRACVFGQIRFNVSRKLFNCWATFGFNRGPKLRMSRQKLPNCCLTVVYFWHRKLSKCCLTCTV